MSAPPQPSLAAHQHEDAHKQRFVDAHLRELEAAMRAAPPGLPMAQYWDLVQPKLAATFPDCSTVWAAVAAGNVDAARAFLEQPGVDVDAYDWWTPTVRHDDGTSTLAYTADNAAHYPDGATLTYIAAAHGHTAMVEMLVDEHGADANKATPDKAKARLIEAWRLDPPPQEDMDVPDGGACPLYIAATNGRADTVRALIERGADVNQIKVDGATPLIGAVWNDSDDGDCADIVTALLENGSDVHQTNHFGNTPVCFASGSGKVATLKVLVEYGGDVRLANPNGTTPISIAAQEGHTAVLEFLLEKGVDVNGARDNGATHISIASAWGHAEALKLLIEKGGEVNKARSNGATPMYVASMWGHVEILKILIEHGGDVHAATSDGSTPVAIASLEGHAGALRILIESGGDVNKATNAGHTPAFFAAREGAWETLQILLDNGGDVNQLDAEGWTPVHVASANGQIDTLQILIKWIIHQANISGRSPNTASITAGHLNTVDFSGTSPLHMAADEGETEVLKILLNHGADIHKPDASNRTPVWIAAQEGHTDSLHTLLKAGANARTANAFGDFTLHIASKQGQIDVVRVLAESWPTNPLGWRMFLMGGGAASELQDYLAPPANRATRNYLPRLYSKPDMMKEIWKFMYKPQYVDPGQLNHFGRTAARIAADNEHGEIVELLQGLGIDEGVDFGALAHVAAVDHGDDY